MLVSALAMTAAVMVSTPRCDALTLPSPALCFQTPNGVVVADDPAVASLYVAALVAGEARFREVFGHEPSSYALIIGEAVNPTTPDGMLGEQVGALEEVLRTAGVKNVLPWSTPAQSAVRMQAWGRAALPGDALRSGAVHELGHRWTKDAFWPDDVIPRAGHYGGPGPDWFDEMAAVLLEGDRVMQTRRRNFRTAWTRPDGPRPKPLSAYFSEPHPVSAAVRQRLTAAAGGEGGGRIQGLPPGVVIRGMDGKELRAEDFPAESQGGTPRVTGLPALGGANVVPRRVRSATVSVEASELLGSEAERDAASMFYSQARVFADFLEQQTGDARIHARIGAAMAAGRTMDRWLEAEGAAVNLPASVAGLEDQWQAWLTRTYGPAG